MIAGIELGGTKTVVAIVSPSRITVGGGVCQAEGLHRKINARLIEIAAGYFSPVLGGDCVVPPALGQQAGICGALLLADCVSVVSAGFIVSASG